MTTTAWPPRTSPLITAAFAGALALGAGALYLAVRATQPPAASRDEAAVLAALASTAPAPDLDTAFWSAASRRSPVLWSTAAAFCAAPEHATLTNCAAVRELAAALRVPTPTEVQR